VTRTKVMVVIGPGRSCTSGVARALHEGGWPMGDDLLPPHESNPWGHFEDVDLIDLNDRMLADAGGDWLTPAPVPASDENRAVVRGYVSHRARHGTQWGMKDPRLAITWPVFDLVFRHDFPELEPILVFPSRELDTVAESLVARDGLPERQAWEWAALYRDATLGYLRDR